MLLHRQKSYRVLVITRYGQRLFVVASFFACAQYMNFWRTLSRLSWLQWTLDDLKLSLTSRIFRTTVSFLPAQFRGKMFVKSELSPHFWRTRRNAHTFKSFDIVLVAMENSTSKCHLTSCWSRHPSFLARNASENPSSKTSWPLATSSLTHPLRNLKNSRFAA